MVVVRLLVCLSVTGVPWLTGRSQMCVKLGQAKFQPSNGNIFKFGSEWKG